MDCPFCGEPMDYEGIDEFAEGMFDVWFCVDCQYTAFDEEHGMTWEDLEEDLDYDN